MVKFDNYHIIVKNNNIFFYKDIHTNINDCTLELKIKSNIDGTEINNFTGTYTYENKTLDFLLNSDSFYNFKQLLLFEGSNTLQKVINYINFNLKELHLLPKICDQKDYLQYGVDLFVIVICIYLSILYLSTKKKINSILFSDLKLLNYTETIDLKYLNYNDFDTFIHYSNIYTETLGRNICTVITPYIIYFKRLFIKKSENVLENDDSYKLECIKNSISNLIVYYQWKDNYKFQEINNLKKFYEIHLKYFIDIYDYCNENIKFNISVVESNIHNLDIYYNKNSDSKVFFLDFYNLDSLLNESNIKLNELGLNLKSVSNPPNPLNLQFNNIQLILKNIYSNFINVLDIYKTSKMNEIKDNDSIRNELKTRLNRYKKRLEQLKTDRFEIEKNFDLVNIKILEFQNKYKNKISETKQQELESLYNEKSKYDIKIKHYNNDIKNCNIEIELVQDKIKNNKWSKLFYLSFDFIYNLLIDFIRKFFN